MLKPSFFWVCFHAFVVGVSLKTENIPMLLISELALFVNTYVYLTYIEEEQ